MKGHLEECGLLSFSEIAPRLMGCAIAGIQIVGPCAEDTFPQGAREASEVQIEFENFYLLLRWKVSLKGEFLSLCFSDKRFRMESEEFPYDLGFDPIGAKKVRGVRCAHYLANNSGEILLWSVALVFADNTSLTICLGEFDASGRPQFACDCVMLTSSPEITYEIVNQISGGNAWGELICEENP